MSKYDVTKDINEVQHYIDILEEVETLDDTLYAYNEEYRNALKGGIKALKIIKHYFIINSSSNSCPNDVVPYSKFIHMLGDWTGKFECPRCGRIFTYDVRNTDVFFCSKCGLPQKMEE